jgi:hypothetical protein
MGPSSDVDHGTAWLAASFLVILFLDSLADITFFQKVVLVVWCYISKVFLHDVHPVTMTSGQKSHSSIQREQLSQMARSNIFPKSNSQEEEVAVSTLVPSPSEITPKDKLNISFADLQRSSSMVTVASTISLSPMSLSSVITDTPPISPTSSTGQNSDENKNGESQHSLNVEQLERVNNFRKMLNLTSENDDELLFTDDYLHSVLCAPNRTSTYAAEKLNRVLNWRQEYGASSITPEDCAPQLHSCSMYWYGYDIFGHPILWLRPKLKNWSTMDKALEIRTHVFLLELGIKYFMPPGITSFTLITDCSNVGYRDVDIQLTKCMIEVCTGNYPDRISHICVGPLTMLVKTLTTIISPLLPTRLRDKSRFMENPELDLVDLIDPESIPDFMGGPAKHTLNPQGNSNVFNFDFMFEEQKRRMQAFVAGQH